MAAFDFKLVGPLFFYTFGEIYSSTASNFMASRKVPNVIFTGVPFVNTSHFCFVHVTSEDKVAHIGHGGDGGSTVVERTAYDDSSYRTLMGTSRISPSIVERNQRAAEGGALLLAIPTARNFQVDFTAELSGSRFTHCLSLVTDFAFLTFSDYSIFYLFPAILWELRILTTSNVARFYPIYGALLSGVATAIP